MTPQPPSVGLAISGGGSRAVAFGLGALRALHDRGVLDSVTVVSGISGGSLLSAMWAYGPTTFADFDLQVVDLLRSGLQRELARRVLHPRTVARNIRSLAAATVSAAADGERMTNRTEALAEALQARGFGRRQLHEVTHPGLSTVLSATDLATGNAVRFGSATSSLSSVGEIIDAGPVADAVAASAAFPALLPPLRRTYRFVDREHHEVTRTLRMTDGGVYDNLGLTPLLPGRSPAHTHHVYPLDYIVAVDAGQGRRVHAAPSFLAGRLKRSFDIAYRKAQDGSRARLNLAAQSGALQGFIHAYLATCDRALPFAPADLLPRADVIEYPTNFGRMHRRDIERLTTRGEQLVRVLIEQYSPSLGQHR